MSNAINELISVSELLADHYLTQDTDKEEPSFRRIEEYTPQYLLKQVLAFEKLALYSDRKYFLQSIAQDAFNPETIKEYYNLDEFGNPKPQNDIKSLLNKEPKLTDNTIENSEHFDPEEIKQYYNLDEFGNPKQTGIPPLSSLKQHPNATWKPVAPDSKMWAKRLVDTLKSYITKVGPQTAQNMMDPKREAIAKQLDSNAVSELIRLYDQTGGINNPYASPEDQQLAQQIKDVVEQFGHTFSAQISSLPNAVKIQAL